MDFSIWQIAIVLVIALLVFGPKKLPELGRALGQGMREFKDSITGHDEESEQAKLAAQPSQPDAGVEPVEGEVVDNRT